MAERGGGLLVLAGLVAGCLVPAEGWLGKGTSGNASGSGSATAATGNADDGADDGGDDGGGGGGDGSDPTADLPPDCAALPSTADPVTLSPDSDLAAELAALSPGTTVQLADGTYLRGNQAPLVITADGVTLRSAGGDAQAVVLDGEGGDGPLVRIAADDVTIAGLTLRSAAAGIEVAPTTTLQRPRLYRLAVHDVQQAVTGLAAAESSGAAHRGVIACSSFDLGDSYRATSRCPKSAVAHVSAGDGWVVQDNTIGGYYCPSDETFATLVFDGGGADTLIRRNVFTDDYRSVVLGNDRDDNPIATDVTGCGGLPYAHLRGRVHDNRFVVTDPALGTSASGVDSMISVWNGCGAEVYHNSIYTAFVPYSGIEWRYDTTRVWVMNNLGNAPYLARDGAVALGESANGTATAADFVNAAAGELSLAPGSAAIDAGAPLPVKGLRIDAVGTMRQGPPDFGALEFTN